MMRVGLPTQSHVKAPNPRVIRNSRSSSVSRFSDPAPVRSALHALWLRGIQAPAHWRYGVGVLAPLVASLVRIALNPFWGTSFPYIFYFPMTLFTALFGRPGSSMVGNRTLRPDDLRVDTTLDRPAPGR